MNTDNVVPVDDKVSIDQASSSELIFFAASSNAKAIRPSKEFCGVIVDPSSKTVHRSFILAFNPIQDSRAFVTIWSRKRSLSFE